MCGKGWLGVTRFTAATSLVYLKVQRKFGSWDNVGWLVEGRVVWMKNVWHEKAAEKCVHVWVCIEMGIRQRKWSDGVNNLRAVEVELDMSSGRGVGGWKNRKAFKYRAHLRRVVCRELKVENHKRAVLGKAENSYKLGGIIFLCSVLRTLRFPYNFLMAEETGWSESRIEKASKKKSKNEVEEKSIGQRGSFKKQVFS